MLPDVLLDDMQSKVLSICMVYNNAFQSILIQLIKRRKSGPCAVSVEGVSSPLQNNLSYKNSSVLHRIFNYFQVFKMNLSRVDIFAQLIPILLRINLVPAVVETCW